MNLRGDSLDSWTSMRSLFHVKWRKSSARTKISSSCCDLTTISHLSRPTSHRAACTNICPNWPDSYGSTLAKTFELKVERSLAIEGRASLHRSVHPCARRRDSRETTYSRSCCGKRQTRRFRRARYPTPN